MMRKSSSIWRLIFTLVVGVLIGTIAGDLLGRVMHIPYLNTTTAINWHPAGDFVILKYDLNLVVKLNLASLLGLGAAFWISRKL